MDRHIRTSAAPFLRLLGLGTLTIVGLLLLPQDASFLALLGSQGGKPILGPCTKYDDVYDDLYFREKKFGEWPEIYHGTVEAIITDHLKASAPADCAAEEYASFLPLGQTARDVAKKLPPWKEEKDLKKLGQEDLGGVLLEYLRAYECALEEHKLLLPIEIIDEEIYGRPTGPKEEGEKGKELDMSYLQLFTELLEHLRVIEREQRTARPALERVLSLIGGISRLRPLDGELECLQRISLDIRNIAALTAETSACLPRIWDARDPLRDIKEK